MQRIGLLVLGSFIAVLTAWGQFASAEEREQPRVLEGFGDSPAIEMAADSWSDLCAKAKPTFTWKGRDMIWVESDEMGQPLFRLNRAYLHEDAAGKSQWVLLKAHEATWGELYREVMGDNLKAVARLQSARHKSDHGSGDYAIVLAESDQFGTVYEVGWQKEMSGGTGHVEAERRLYFLRDRGGKWTFLGEGPEEQNGKGGYSRGYISSCEPSAIWERTGDVPCKIHFLIKSHDVELGEKDPGEPWLRDQIVYEEEVLEGVSRQLRRITDRPYLRTVPGDNLTALVEHLSSWTFGWDSGGKKERQRIKKMWREALLRLNPDLDFENLATGTKVSLLMYHETVALLDKTAKSSAPPNAAPGVALTTFAMFAIICSLILFRVR